MASGSSQTRIPDGGSKTLGALADAAVGDATGSVNAHLRQIAKLITAPALAAVAVTFTRPADTTAYAAQDAVSDSTSAPTVRAFAAMAKANGGAGQIVKARMMTDQSSFAARLRLHIFHTAPTAINDNAQQTLLWGNRAIRVGQVDFPAAGTEGSGSTGASASVVALHLPFICDAGDTSLYGLLETLDAFTPASGQQFYLELTAEQV